ncbi:MAG: hypothetical protein Q8O04_10900 [Deltaproteobacteria bacterium]|nr:hypothetical protein [Deltaproteobacteria bacterium]
MPPRKKQNGIPANAIILGFTGSLGSGCSYIAEGIAKELTEYKFVSLSAPIYEKAGTGAQKSELQDIGDELRREHGRSFFAKEAIDRLKSSGETHKKIIINSIRNDQEVLYLRQFPNFYLFSIYAPRDVRFKRLKKKHYGEDRSSFDKDDERDSKNIDPFGQQVSKCNYLADIVINNQDIPPSSRIRKRNFIQEIISRYVKLIEDGPSVELRPSMDETLMTMAYCESLGSSCLQRKVGAIIATEDGHVISTGKNDVPKNQGTCKEEYNRCYRNYVKELHASKLKHCPNCGTKIEMTPYDCPHCKSEGRGHKLSQYYRNCPDCAQELIPSYQCPECGISVFDQFVPGGKGSPGKLLDVCRSLHAEENAIIKLSKIGGVSSENKILYTTTYPCTLCANKIVEIGISRVVFAEPYTMPEVEELFRAKKIKVDKFEGVKSRAFFRLYGEGL